MPFIRMKEGDEEDGFFRRHPIVSNIIIIILVAFIGLWIVYISLKLFTRHGESEIVPGVENMSYTQAVNTLHKKGFRVDIRDSIYNEDVKPGFVVEQFPKSGASVKPGRKVFLYINAVHPREVVIDEDNKPEEDALKGFSFRQGMAKLEELGFRHVNVVKVLGDNDRIIRIIANGKTVKKMGKVPVNALITVEVCDGRMNDVTDSIQNEEYKRYVEEEGSYEESSYGSHNNYYDEEAEEEPIFVQ